MSLNQEEIACVFSKDDFYFTETLYRVLIPICDDLYAETACKQNGMDEGWERVRDAVVKRMMQYDGTTKLWSATRRHHPLYQQLPHTIYYGDESQSYFTLKRLAIPTNLLEARKEFRTAVKTGQTQALKPDAANIISDWSFQRDTRRRLFKALKIASHMTPRAATNSRIFATLVKHSLQTELLSDLEINAHSMGLINNNEDYDFSNVIHKFQEPSERMIPMSFITAYKTSLYARCPKYIAPATMWDSEPIQSIVRKDAAVEYSFIVQNLITAWPRRFDKLHDFDHQVPIKDVLPENFDLSKVKVFRSNSKWAKIARGEHDFPENDNNEADDWIGYKSLQEKKIDMKGLRPRKNATNLAE